MMKQHILWMFLSLFFLMGCQSRAEQNTQAICIPFYECGAWKECVSVDVHNKTLVGATQDNICTDALYRFKKNHSSALRLKNFMLPFLASYVKLGACEESVEGGNPEDTYPIGRLHPACCAKIKPCSTGPVKLDP